MKHLLLLLITLIVLRVHSQDLMFKKIIENPKIDARLTTLTDTERKEAGIMLKNQTYIEYHFDSLGQLECWQGVLKRIKINDSKALEIYNKIVLPVPNPDDLSYIKARSISKNGLVKEVGIEAVRELEERGRIYKILAVEGLEVGGELEYVSLFRRNTTLFGTEILQSEIPARSCELKIIAPKHLQFEAKAYNTAANIVSDTLQEKSILTVTVNNLGVIQEEKYANLRANVARIDYKLSYNLSRGDERLYTWAGAADTFYDYLNTGLDESKKAIDALIIKEKWKGLPPEMAIRKIENYIKTNIALKEDEEVGSADEVLQKQYGAKAGIVRLYIAIFEALKIPYETVVGCSRADAIFDKDFESWNFLDEYLFYFPLAKKFLDPANPIYRYGMIDQYMEGNYALFIQKKSDKFGTTAVGEIRKIPFSTITDNHDDLEIMAAFSPALDQIEGTVKRQMTGHQAAQLRPYYHFIKAEEERKSLTNEIIKSTLKPDVTFTNAQVKNTNLNNDEVSKPFILSANITLKSVIERAGKKYLFKIGELIGPQVEMYDERPRQFMIDMGNAHAYQRVLKVKIPEGFTVSGLEGLRRNITDGKAQPDMAFISDYKLENNMLTVKIEEYYKTAVKPLEVYTIFQKIINAAADFNKVTLILEKK